LKMPDRFVIEMLLRKETILNVTAIQGSSLQRNGAFFVARSLKEVLKLLLILTTGWNIRVMANGNF